MSFFSEFKDFAVRGNVLDMAIGVVIGGAFGQITTSLVNNVIMPRRCLRADYHFVGKQRNYAAAGHDDWQN